MKYEITKGSEKDLEGAPDEALFVLQCYSTVDYSVDMKATIDGQSLTPHDFQYIIAERRPITEPVWDGEGLMPSVGMKCLAKQCSQINADEFLVVAIQDGAVFGFWTATGAATGLDVNRWIFLPIRSPEDVARDESIEAMRDVGYTLPAAIRFTKEEMAALYDAGYRKME